MSEPRATDAPPTALDIKPEPAHATLKEIARRCGVGISTAGFALTGEGRVSRSTSERVFAVAQELGYSLASNRAARRMASVRLGKPFTNHAVALFLPSVSDHANYWLEIQNGILGSLADEQYDLLTTQIDDPAKPMRLPHAVLAGEVDGAIVIKPEEAAQLRALPSFGARPIVGILEQFDNCASVLADDEEAARLAAGHLLDLGHRHLFHFCWVETKHRFPLVPRIAGYQHACRERGLDPDAILHSLVTPYYRPRREWVVKYMWEGLKRYPKTTALLPLSDDDANVLYCALISAGRRVPEDISIVSCDDVQAVNDEHGRNILTTVNLSIRALGETAGRLLVELVTGKVSGIVRRTMPAHLVVRASTAGPRPRTSEAR